MGLVIKSNTDPEGLVGGPQGFYQLSLSEELASVSFDAFLKEARIVGGRD